MPAPEPRFYLISPSIEDPATFAAALEAACGTGQVAAVLLRLAPGDERGLVNRVKALAPVAQRHGVAVLVADPGEAADLATLVARGGADGAHAQGGARLAELRARLKDGASLGAGGLRTKHDAMEAGEAEVDYVMFGEPRPDGWVPDLDSVEDRAGWWVEIFQTPCAVYAARIADVPRVAATGAEFIVLGDAVWSCPGGPAEALAAAAAQLGPERAP